MKEPEFSPVKILNISLSNYGFVIFLQKEGEDKVLPICIGAAEVNSISEALSQQKFPRPSSHTLFRNILSDLGYRIIKIEVTELKEGTYYAKIYTEGRGEATVFDARPSDAISLALRFDAPIYVHRDLFREAGVTMDESKEKLDDKVTPLQALKKALDRAVDEERYEDAVKLREKIQQIELDDLMNN
jgi:bifunctional DNase/RNase